MSRTKTAFLWLFSIFYVGAGINHFRAPEFYLPMMPPYLPEPMALIYLSGVIEIGLGLLVLIPRWRACAAWAVIAMLVAFMPVHIHMVAHPELYPDVPEAGLWLRLPMQGLFAAWAYWLTRGATSCRRTAR